MALFQKGIILEQHKEPAFSRDIYEFINSGSASVYFEDWEAVERLTIDSLADCAKKAGIVDESDGVDLYKKILSAKNGGYISVVADAIDDEPYISSQMAPAYWFGEEMVGGLRLLEEIFDAKRIYIAMYRNVGELSIKLPNEINSVEIKYIRGRYPAEQRAKRKLHYRSAMVVGSGALIHLYRAYTQRRVQTTTFVTVAGNSVSNPMNLEVSLGMTVSQVLDKCGLSNTPTRVVIGGSMTGISVIDTDNTLITNTTRSVLAFNDKYIKSNYTCIGCGRCTENCPMGLSPYYIYKLIKSNQYGKLERFDAKSCIGCGICSYNCPAKLEISTTIFDYVLKEKQKEIQTKEFLEIKEIKPKEKSSQNKETKEKKIKKSKNKK